MDRAWVRAAVLLGCAGFFGLALSYLWGPVRSGNMAFNDFFAHWSYARMAVERPGAAMYDPAAVHDFQRELFDGRLKKNPFVYPPAYALLVLPLAALGFWVAAMAWAAASVGAFAVAAGWGRGWLAALAALCPAVAVGVAYGQVSLLAAAMLAGGLRLLQTRPGWAGLLLACACIKPQLAFLVPVALLAGRQWQAVWAGLATGAILVAASAWWMGLGAWPAWFAALAGQGEFAAGAVSPYRQVTVAASLAILGMDRDLAMSVQAGVAVAVLAGVMLAWRRGPSAPAAGAVLAGALVATPYAFQYDLALAAAAVLGLLAEGRRLHPAEAAVLVAAFVLPAVLFLTSRFYWTGPVVLAALFAVCVAQAIRR